MYNIYRKNKRCVLAQIARNIGVLCIAACSAIDYKSYNENATTVFSIKPFLCISQREYIRNNIIWLVRYGMVCRGCVVVKPFCVILYVVRYSILYSFFLVFFSTVSLCMLSLFHFPLSFSVHYSLCDVAVVFHLFIHISIHCWFIASKGWLIFGLLLTILIAIYIYSKDMHFGIHVQVKLFALSLLFISFIDL